MSRLDILLIITRIFIQAGFMVASGAMLPPLLRQFHWRKPVIWRTSSAILAALSLLFALMYPARRKVASEACGSMSH
jgi:hypothetical protein